MSGQYWVRPWSTRPPASGSRVRILDPASTTRLKFSGTSENISGAPATKFTCIIGAVRGTTSDDLSGFKLTDSSCAHR